MNWEKYLRRLVSEACPVCVWFSAGGLLVNVQADRLTVAGDKVRFNVSPVVGASVWFSASLVDSVDDSGRVCHVKLGAWASGAPVRDHGGLPEAARASSIFRGGWS